MRQTLFLSVIFRLGMFGNETNAFLSQSEQVPTCIKLQLFKGGAHECSQARARGRARAKLPGASRGREDFYLAAYPLDTVAPV